VTERSDAFGDVILICASIKVSSSGKGECTFDDFCISDGRVLGSQGTSTTAFASIRRIFG
jgi:hypothetical protein